MNTILIVMHNHFFYRKTNDARKSQLVRLMKFDGAFMKYPLVPRSAEDFNTDQERLKKALARRNLLQCHHNTQGNYRIYDGRVSFFTKSFRGRRIVWGAFIDQKIEKTFLPARSPIFARAVYSNPSIS